MAGLRYFSVLGKEQTKKKHTHAHNKTFRMDAKLYDRYNDLVGMEEVRALLGAVAQDAEAETVDSAHTSKPLSALVETNPELLETPRRKIIGFFNSAWMNGLDNLSQRFWWEMRYRFLKLLHVSIVLEALNLKIKLGAKTANARDVPQALVFTYHYVTVECTDEKLSAVSEEFDGMCTRHKVYVDLYLDQF